MQILSWLRGKKRPLLVLMRFSVVGFSLFWCVQLCPRGVVQPETLAQPYFDALQRGDAFAIRQLIPMTHVAGQAIQAKITLLQEENLQDLQVRFNAETGFPYLCEIIISGQYSDTGRTFRDSTSCQKWGSERWFVILGQYKPALGVFDLLWVLLWDKWIWLLVGVGIILLGHRVKRLV